MVYGEGCRLAGMVFIQMVVCIINMDVWIQV
jgi:hypothetical protein